MEVVRNVLIWFIPVVAILVAALMLHKVFRGSNKKNVVDHTQSQPAEQFSPGTEPAVSHKTPQPETPSADSNKKAAPQKVKVKVVPRKQPKR